MNASIGSMENVLKLTRAGRLAEATAVIQQALAGRRSTVGRHDGSGSIGPYASTPDREPVGSLCIERRPQTPSLDLSAKEISRTSPGFVWREVRCDAGSRRYKLYVPATTREASRPLVVMLHGCAQGPDDFAAGTRMNDLADEIAFLVVYPEQPRSANSSGCWNWFRSGDQHRGGGEPAIIAAIVAQIMGEHAVSPGKVFVAGLSAGGAAAAVMGQAYPDLFAAVGVHSGLACGAARDMPTAFKAMRGGADTPCNAGRSVPTIVFHGTADRTVHPGNAAMVVEQAGGRLVLDDVSDRSDDGTRYRRRIFADESGRPIAEDWSIDGAGHVWSGGSERGSYTDPRGPDASREMIRFFGLCADVSQ